MSSTHETQKIPEEKNAYYEEGKRKNRGEGKTNIHMSVRTEMQLKATSILFM